MVYGWREAVDTVVCCVPPLTSVHEYPGLRAVNPRESVNVPALYAIELPLESYDDENF